MSRGYSGVALVCVSALCFILGRFVQELPGLPDTSSGFKTRTRNPPALTVSTGLRRRTFEVQDAGDQASIRAANQSAQAGEGQALREQQALHQQKAAPNLKRGGAGKPAEDSQDVPKSFDEAVEALLLPPIEPAESGAAFYSTQPYQLLSNYPRMYLFPRFLDEERADHVVKLARARLGPSALAFRPGDSADTTKDVRTSQGTFMARRDDPDGVLAWIEDKIATLTHIPVAHGEPFNVLRYQLGQHYDSHYDVFEPDSYGPQQSQRMATVLFYLSDVEEGGETVFPLEGKHGLDRLPTIDYRSCNQGYKYKPRKGDALLFYSTHTNGTFDKHALHGGCAVVSGEKWVATKWIRDSCFGTCH